MRKALIIPFTIMAVAACVMLNSALSPTQDFVTDKALETNSRISAMEAFDNIPLDELFTEDPFRVTVIGNGDTEPVTAIPGLNQNNKITGAASYAAFMDSKIDLSKVDLQLQTSILTDMINTYQYGKDKITLISGTGSGLKGDTSALEALVNKTGKTVSFMAIRLRDGASIGYNVDDFFQSCSTVKTPLTLYAAQLIDQGELSYNDVFTYTDAAYISGSGVIKNYGTGARFKLKTLITYAITESDNIAYQMLCINLGVSNYYKYLDELGCDVRPEDKSTNRYWPDSNARSSALWWSQVYLFKNSGEVGSWYWNLFNIAPSRIDTALAHSKPCYTKSGSSSYCMHEAGIVMGDDPYLVVIFTSSSTASGNTESYFYQVAREIDALISN
ncbi:MAG: class A beta-lactamase-related serine hydrolase [Eubacteriales bacterium]|nr:class A beta-lactamase-related serine hydrolase [Eubacteriales bacterium]